MAAFHSPLQLGLMSHSIGTPERYSRQARAAVAEGFGTVVLFEPASVDPARHLLSGWVYAFRRGWRYVTAMPYPGINLDIGYYTSPAAVLNAIRAKRNGELNFAGYGLGNKWTIQRHLLRSKRLAPYLLPTMPATDGPSVLGFAERHSAIMLKPLNGKGGQGIVRLNAVPVHPGPRIDGKAERRYPAWAYAACDNFTDTPLPTPKAAAAYIRRRLAGGPHLMQQWIDIRSLEGRVYDIRALVQKDGSGHWVLSGLAVREGQAHRITSNLKTGGQAFAAEAYLKRQFGGAHARALTAAARELAAYLPSYLEQSYNHRLCELGIDLAVDHTGRLWLLEVNIKPGRRVIQQLYGHAAYESCFRLPFAYARFLLNAPPEQPFQTPPLLEEEKPDGAGPL